MKRPYTGLYREFRRSQEDGRGWRARLCSALASTLVIIPFGLAIAGIVAAALPLETLREILYFLGGACYDSPLVAAALSLGIAAIFGALVGAFIGLSSDVAALLRNTWSLVAERRRRP